MKYVIAANRIWYKNMPVKLAALTKQEFILIDKKEDLTFELLQDIKPRYIFFPHWSFIIPKEIYENYESVIFHMTDVPFGRGGSPLQNLIARGIFDTKISALMCQEDLDAGPVYLKRPFSLFGSAEEIYIRAAKEIEEMIVYIIENEPNPVKQQGEVVYFNRRKQEDGNIANLTDLEQVFNYIRMLDAKDYPRAFLENGNFRFEFQRASLKNDYVIADVKITKRR
ncbi:methionyl-tRNA formyltransferase [Desulforamulus aquiferis]|uniref:Methionyl-tRNA formyltransferase n=1 Tax=Desulforamulus aquiferis TaxID=1397668 RepID=A0AAW7ZG91_9FIRM|nr:methionyl-tRNA formyltransferase [Desulforamulus aquiferis]MDO7788351.1 methionyl-tRNA formyltransferase [Desulforamulus aquiferis]RYD06309.1 hypothetical protein N752_05295 [Desulforamulus aquiferis]